jgi:hypothetical protein
MRPEEELISILSQVRLKEQRLIRLEDLLKDNLDWDYIFNRSKEESVYPFIYYHLNNSPYKDYIPNGILEQFKTAYYSNSLTNLRLYEEAKRIFKIFNEENIKAIVLKGIFLAENIYKNIALRPMTDVDILIKKEDLLKVNAILNSLGYSAGVNCQAVLRQPFSYSLTFSPQASNEANSFCIDVHWHILSSTWLTGFLSDKIDLERIWLQAEPVKIEDVDALTLSPAHLLLYLAQHGFAHSFKRLIMLTDIIEIFRHYRNKVDWDILREEAERLQLVNILSYSLYFASRKLGANLPEIEKIISTDGKFRRNILYRLRNINIYGFPCFIYILLQNSFKNKLRFASKAISLSTHLMAHS